MDTPGAGRWTPLAGLVHAVTRPLFLGAVVVAFVLVGTGVKLSSRPHPPASQTGPFPSCPCTFTYPSSWWYDAANNDLAKPNYEVYSYDPVSADHAPIPDAFTTISVDWLCDPGGELYKLTASNTLTRMTPQTTTVSGFPAVAFSHWTAPLSDGGVYEQHVYFYVAAYQRDYNLTLLTANPPTRNVQRGLASFAAFLHSFHIMTTGSTSLGATACVRSQPTSSPSTRRS